ncbi:MAG: glycosyltransferase 87 family protein [Segniliparus sp.]|uniref:glycosyltransferase 87 family protein n=1 Tax=Segniliparus sp. TaxID=2804064 RepID=UPI003F358386
MATPDPSAPGASETRCPAALLWTSVALAAFALAAQSLLIPFDLLHQDLVTNSRDFLIYSDGARTALDGRPLYTAPVGEDGFFTYPPFAALCFAPFTVLSGEAGGLTWSILCYLLLALVVGRALRLAGLRPDLRLGLTSLALAAAAAALEPVRTTLWYGQINILLMALIFLDLTRPERSKLRGVGVGIAAGIKLIPLIFLPYLVLTRQWRAAATAALTFAATVALSWAVLPGDSAQYWFHAVRDTSHIGELFHPANQSVNGFLARIWKPDHSPGWIWPVLAAAVIAVGLGLARLAHDRGEEALGLLLVGLTSCAASPFTWGHHWVWFAPLIAWFVAQAVHASQAIVPADQADESPASGRCPHQGGRRRRVQVTARNEQGTRGADNAGDRRLSAGARWGAAAAALYAWAFVWPWHKPPSTPEEPRVVPGLFYHYLDTGDPWYRHVASGWYMLAYLVILVGIASWLRSPRAHGARPLAEAVPTHPTAGA